MDAAAGADRTLLSEDRPTGAPTFSLPVLLRIYFLQHWYGLSDPLLDLGAEEALYDSQSLRQLAWLELGRDAIPDETVLGLDPAIQEQRIETYAFLITG